MHIGICAGGPKEEVARDVLFSIRDAYWIGADHGAIYLLESGITPDLAVGDFDSLTEEEWQWIRRSVQNIERHKPEKDETDTELAIVRALEMSPEVITIFGATGGRLDHYEANLHIVYRLQKKFPHCTIQLMNGTNQIQFLFPGTKRLSYDAAFQYVSFFAFGETVHNVTLRGVKYETTKETIEMGTTRFTSNEIARTGGAISFDTGAVLMIRSIDL